MKLSPPDDVRAAIAGFMLGAREALTALDVGDVVLHEHQRDAIPRILGLLERHGGALLADDVGLGKTFAALGVGRGFRDTLVIAPAALRDAWLAASRRTRVDVDFVSIEALSRTGAPARRPGFVIVDEAHHFRGRRTARFAAAAALCREARVLLLSATPIQNRLADLRTILSLFLGERAFALGAQELAQCIVRRLAADLPGNPGYELPAVRAPRWVRAGDDADCLERLMALPAPLPASDAHDGGALVAYSLVRQWSSSRAALRAALSRRLAQARAMEDILRAGRFPTRAELRAWCYADGVQQLSFPELISDCPASGAAELLDRVQSHAAAIRDVVRALETTRDPDDARADALAELLRAHDGERVIAFSEYAETVYALYKRLGGRARVAMLTHRGGRVAGGALSRRDVLGSFSGTGPAAPAVERIDVLLTTDVLSEGVDLQGASVVVHLDLSWNPARLAQRVGRLRRPGAARDAVSVYLFPPPAPADQLLRIERRLRFKIGVAARTVGVAGAILPEILPARERDDTSSYEERIATVLRGWRRSTSTVVAPGPVAAVVAASRDGAIACVRRGAHAELVGRADGAWTSDRSAVAELLSVASGREATVDFADCRSIAQDLMEWVQRDRASAIVDLTALHLAHSRRSLLRRVDTIAHQTPRRSQAVLAPLMRAARRAATATLSAGAERVLEELAQAPLSDEAWLHAVGEFSTLHARPSGDDAAELLALLVFRSSPELRHSPREGS